MPSLPSVPASPLDGAFDGTGGTGKMFSVYQDSDGNLVMLAGYLLALRAGVQIFVGDSTLNRSFEVIQGSRGPSRTPLPSSLFIGGSGRNLSLTAESSTFPAGFYLPEQTNEFGFLFNGDFRIIMAGDGSGTITDGTNVVASAPAATFTIVPEGVFTATSYGRTTYNGGTAFDITTTWEGGADQPGCALTTSAGTLTEQHFTATAPEDYTGDTDASFTITINGDGSADIDDGTNILASRIAGGLLYDPAGTYPATSYGKTTYNSGDDFSALVERDVANPVEGWAYVIVTESSSGVPSTVDGPYFETALPANADPIFYVPIAYSDGLNGIRQVQEGAILWY